MARHPNLTPAMSVATTEVLYWHVPKSMGSMLDRGGLWEVMEVFMACDSSHTEHGLTTVM